MDRNSNDELETVNNPFANPAPEILQEIFEHIITERDQSTYGLQVSIRSVSQVSRYWRGTAINNHSLWGRLLDFYSDPKWFNELVLRSNSTSLFVASSRKGDHDYGEVFTNWNILYPHLWRCRTITTQIWPFLRLGEDCIGQLLSQDMPQLVALYLEGPDELEFPLPVTPSWQTLAKVAPKLSLLNLQGCIIDLETLIFDGLNTLEVDKIPKDYRPSAEEWLQALNRLPRLTALRIVNGILVENAGNLNDAAVVQLPHLKEIRIRTDLRICQKFLSKIVFPNQCSIRLTCTAVSTDQNREQLLSCLSVLYNYFTRNHRYPTKWHFRVRPGAVCFYDESAETSTEICIAIICPGFLRAFRTSQFEASIIRLMSEKAYSSSILAATSLDISITIPNITEIQDSIHLFVSAFHQIETLTLCNSTIPELTLKILQALPIADLPEGSKYVPGTPIFPKLGQILVDGSVVIEPPLWASIFGYVVWRHDLQFRIPELRLTCRDQSNTARIPSKDIKRTPKTKIYWVCKDVNLLEIWRMNKDSSCYGEG